MSGTNGNGASAEMRFDEETCERYLFGELSEPEQENFETAYFDDDAFFNRFLAVKDELLDLYARNELDANKKMRLESHFLSTAPRRKRLAESRDFINSVSTIANRKAPMKADRLAEPQQLTMLESIKRFFTVPALASVGLILVLFAIGLWFMKFADAPDRVAEPNAQGIPTSDVPSNAEVTLTNTTPDGNRDVPAQSGTGPSPLPKRPDETEIATNPVADPPTANVQVPVPSQSVEPVLPQPATSPKPHVAEVVKPDEPKVDDGGARTESVTLSSTSRSVTRSNTASIGSSTQNVVVRMFFGGEAYPSYSVRVTTLGGATVWRASNLTTGMGDGPKSLAVTISAGALTRSDYIVVLEGRSKDGKSETIREYYLHVDRH